MTEKTTGSIDAALDRLAEMDTETTGHEHAKDAPHVTKKRDYAGSAHVGGHQNVLLRAIYWQCEKCGSIFERHKLRNE